MDEALTAAQTAARNAKRFAVLTVAAVIVAVAVLAIDNGLKRAILDGEARIRIMLDETRELLAGGRNDGTSAAGEARAPARADLNGDSGVVHDAAAGAVLDETPDVAKPAPAKRPARKTGGTRRDG